jgi:hypothetical protein
VAGSIAKVTLLSLLALRRQLTRADEKLTAFVELESAIQTDRHNHECDCPEPDEELGSNR